MTFLPMLYWLLGTSVRGKSPDKRKTGRPSPSFFERMCQVASTGHQQRIFGTNISCSQYNENPKWSAQVVKQHIQAVRLQWVDRVRNRWFGSAIYWQSLLGRGLKAI